MVNFQQQFNSALTGATFLLQQTPTWKQKAEAAKVETQRKQINKAGEKAAQSVEAAGPEQMLKAKLPYAQMNADLINQNKTLFPEEFARNQMWQQAVEEAYADRSKSAMATELSARANSRNTMSSMKEMLTKMRDSGAMSNTQYKHYMHEASKMEDEKK